MHIEAKALKADKQQKPSHNIHDVACFAPEPEVEDDEAAVEKFECWMRKQAKLPDSKQDSGGASLRMKKTFSARRSFIASGQHDVGEVKEKYPLLFKVSIIFTSIFMHIPCWFISF
jgi:hypothetical protein